MWFHKHKWEEVERFYASPNKELKNFEFAGQDLLRQLAFGITTIIYKCNCGQLQLIELFGISENKK